MNLSNYKMTERTKQLWDALYKRGFGNRSSEWFKQEDLRDIAREHHNEPVIKRRAYAIKAMLEALTDSYITKYTHTYDIQESELIVGVLPMGSNGLGKIFPNYLTEEEKRVATATNRTELSLLGHNTVNYERLLKGGIRSILADCDAKLKAIGKPTKEGDQDKIDFYEAVKISLQAVVDYAGRFADLAAEKAYHEQNAVRKQELLEIERICRKVPMEKPDSFYEAIQSIYFVHVALHSSLDFISLGRLDQVLNTYLDNTIGDGKKDLKKAIELFECFIIKAAGRLNLTTEYLLEQDHMDYNAALGTHPYYLDQKAGVNNFLQNIIIGGKTPEGKDAVNECSYVILQSFENVNLSTPGIYVRLGSDSPTAFKEAVARTLHETKNLPGILNDDVLIPAMYVALVENEANMERDLLREYERLANDYCVDGCWEPILNGESDWTFGMINGMTILECSLNKGATLDPNPNMLRGGKLSFSSGAINNYDDLKDALKDHLQFFVDQSTLSMYQCYLMDEFINPTPLLSAFLGTCMEYGKDKSWGGTKYNVGGTIIIGVPNMVNTICAIKKWVFDKNKYHLEDVIEGMRSNFTCKEDKERQKLYHEIRKDFRKHSPKFGNNDDESNSVAKLILNYYYDAVVNAKKLADKLFLQKPIDKYEEKKINRLRKIAGYYGGGFRDLLGPHFNIRYTAGCGTFEQYPLQGTGVVACADRDRGEPLAPNFSPMPGSVTNGIGHVLASFQDLGLSRFAAGVMTDLTLEKEYDDLDTIGRVLESFIENKGCMLTLSISDSTTYKEIYDLSVEANKGNAEARKALEAYAHINVRVGGWQAPFISMSLAQQKNYIDRPISAGCPSGN